MRRDSGMLHPVALSALAVLVLNDHVWKARYPGWVTGKLSDVAGLIVFPLVACALARVAVRARPERVLAAAIAATMIGFALVKLWPPATHACALAMGALQAPLSPGPVTIVRDPTDLLALPFALVAWWLPRSVDDDRDRTVAATRGMLTPRDHEARGPRDGDRLAGAGRDAGHLA